MKHYTAEENHFCEIFEDGENEVELLSAILTWWRRERRKHPLANLTTISFLWKEGSCSAEVYWYWVTKGTVEKITKAATEQVPLVVDEKRLSGN